MLNTNKGVGEGGSMTVTYHNTVDSVPEDVVGELDDPPHL